MERWRVEDLVELARAAYGAGLGSFVVRGTIQRLERGAMPPLEAAWLIRRSFYDAPSASSSMPFDL